MAADVADGEKRKEKEEPFDKLRAYGPSAGLRTYGRQEIVTQFTSTFSFSDQHIKDAEWAAALLLEQREREWVKKTVPSSRFKVQGSERAEKAETDHE